MFPEGPHQGAVVCPNLESCDAFQVVVALLYGVYDGQAFQFDRAVSGLCRRQGGAAALYQCELVFIYLDESEANSV